MLRTEAPPATGGFDSQSSRPAGTTAYAGPVDCLCPRATASSFAGFIGAGRKSLLRKDVLAMCMELTKTNKQTGESIQATAQAAKTGLRAPKLIGAINSAHLTRMTSIGQRTGLFDAVHEQARPAQVRVHMLFH
ncbi:MAG TPA: hypothetical protein VNL70_04780, partial [Tepidisphaeraceae bacterium]|nr:hypothetical protein [Tepidisphaeraceae bacterium]